VSQVQLHQVFRERTFSGLFHQLPIRFIMALNPRIWQTMALVLVACHQAAPSDTAPARCAASVPRTAHHPLASRPAALAGDYDLVQVQTQPTGGKTTAGHLHLVELDSSARARAAGGPVRDLTGWLETAAGDSAWRSNVGSRDPRSPGVVLAGDHVMLGRASLDTYTEHLTITAVSPDGFWGWWRGVPGFNVAMDTAAGRVLPDPAGYFCALRVTRSQ
jgi:hypothetical protein